MQEHCGFYVAKTERVVAETKNEMKMVNNIDFGLVSMVFLSDVSSFKFP